MNRFVCFAAPVGLVALLTAGLGAAAQDPDKSQLAQAGDNQAKRLVYTVQHGSANELAGLLNKHFKDDAHFESGSSAGGNVLLINAKATIHDEILQTLAKLDRKPRSVGIELILMDVATKKSADGKLAPADINDKELSGPADRVLAKIKELQKSGVVSTFGQFQVAAVEGRATKLTDGGSKPYITASIIVTGTDGKPMTRNTVLNRDLGTQFTLTPRIGADSGVTLEMQIKNSRGVPSTSGIAIGKDEEGNPIYATEFPVADFNGNVTLAFGQALLVKDLQTTSKAGGVRTLAVVVVRQLP